MKKTLLILVSLVSFITYSQEFTPKNWITDLGNFYTPEEEVYLNKKISDYEKLTSIEIAVVTIESLGDNYIEKFASDEFKRLGVGKKGADNGILIVFSMKDRKSRIEVGNGMEPFFTDINAYSALDLSKVSFKEGKYAKGTSDCIQYITSKLGNQAFENKVLWLKQKKDKEDKEYAASEEKFKSGVINFLLISLFFGTLFFIYYLDKKRREKIAKEKERLRLEAEREFERVRKEAERVERVKQNILKIEIYLKSVRVNRPVTQNSKLLTLSFSSVTSFISSIVISKGDMSNDQYIEVLFGIKDTLDSKNDAYDSLNSEYTSDINNFSNLDILANSAYSYNKIALSALEKIKQYGYDKDYKDLTSSIETLLDSKLAIEKLFLTDVDKAISDAKKFKKSIDYLKEKGSNITNYLNEIESTKTKINNAESLFTSGLNKLDRYKKWMKVGEVDRVKSEFQKFKIKSNNSTDYLALILIFTGVMSALSSLEATLSGRKSKEEEEERTEQRRLAALAAALAEAGRRRREDDDRRRRDSYSSSSSSDSGSSFGGFGGGSSSGGGASNDW
jgi:uncharacterized membrane protein YgcG